MYTIIYRYFKLVCVVVVFLFSLFVYTKFNFRILEEKKNKKVKKIKGRRRIYERTNEREKKWRNE